MATQLGSVVCNFGFETTTNGITMSGTGIGTFTPQSASHSKQASVEEVKSAAGETVQRAFYDFSEDATLEYMVSGSTIADAKTQATIPAPGTIVSITACASMPSIIATNWVVEPGVSIGGSNTDFKRVSLPLKKHAGITAASTAS